MNKARVAEAARGTFQNYSLRPCVGGERVDCCVQQPSPDVRSNGLGLRT